MYQDIFHPSVTSPKESPSPGKINELKNTRMHHRNQKYRQRRYVNIAIVIKNTNKKNKVARKVNHSLVGTLVN